MNLDALNWILVSSGSLPPAERPVWVEDLAGRRFLAYWEQESESGARWYRAGTRQSYAPPPLDRRIVAWAEGAVAMPPPPLGVSG